MLGVVGGGLSLSAACEGDECGTHIVEFPLVTVLPFGISTAFATLVFFTLEVEGTEGAAGEFDVLSGDAFTRVDRLRDMMCLFSILQFLNSRMVM